MNEFKERVQFLLSEALNPPKKQQCLIEFNRLLVQNKTDQHLKAVLSILENNKINEITLRALKISIQVFKYDSISAYKAAAIINKSFTIEQHQLCGECYRLLATQETIIPLCELLCPLALKLNSQPVQIGATIALHYLLQFEIPSTIKKLIQQAYIKNQLIIHQAMVEIMIKITSNQDPQLIQIIQRSLAGLQESKHTYQIKQQLCRLLNTVATYQEYDENLLLQCITILREATLDRVQSVQQAAKQALQVYQGLYIAKNPPAVTSSSYFPDVKPFIKKKRGDNHLVLDADKYKKIQQSQVKQQLEKIQEKVTEQKIQDSLIDQFIKQEQKQEQDEQDDEMPEIIEEQNDDPHLQDTQLFEDELEQTQDFTSDYQQEVMNFLEEGQVDEAFALVLTNKDDFLLMNLMMSVDNYFSELSAKTAEQLIKKFNAIHKSNFIEVMFRDFAKEALKMPEMLKIGQINQLQKFI